MKKGVKRFALFVTVLTATVNAQLYGPDVNLTLSWGYDITPDCVKRQPLIEVNGLWPPPTIYVKATEIRSFLARSVIFWPAFT